MNPDGLAALARADDYEQVKAVAEYYAEYAALFDGSGNNPGDKTLEDKFFEHEVSSLHHIFFNFVLIWSRLFLSRVGEIECIRIHSAIPFRRILRLFEAEGARVPKHCLDIRVCGTKASGQNRQLHSDLLIALHTH